jgi:hypothetical protein
MEKEQQPLSDEIADRVFRILVDSLVDAKQIAEIESKFAEKIIEGICRGVDNFLNQSPTLSSSVVSTQPLALSKKMFDLLGLNCENSSIGSPLYEVKKRVLFGSDELVRNSKVYLQAKEFQKTGIDKTSREFLEQLRPECLNAFRLELLEFSKSFVGGLSGSQVFRVHTRTSDGPKKLGVLKTTDSLIDFEAEKKGLTLVSKGWISEYCDSSFQEAELSIDGQVVYALLTSLAFPPSQFTPDIPTLHDVIASSQTRCIGIGKLLGNQFAKNFSCHSESEMESISSFCQRLILHWPRLVKSLPDVDFWFPVGLPMHEHKNFSDNTGTFRNPINVFFANDLENESHHEFKYALQHGDLNARNVLLQNDDCKFSKPALIDFEKAGVEGGLLDPCYLALFALEASRPNLSSLRDGFDNLHDSFVKCVCLGEEADLHHKSWQLGLDCAKELVAPIWKMAKSRAEKSDLTRQLHLTLSVAAMARCYYEVNALHDGKSTNLFLAILNARLFFRISAAALKPYVQLDAAGVRPVSIDGDNDILFSRLVNV